MEYLDRIRFTSNILNNKMKMFKVIFGLAGIVMFASGCNQSGQQQNTDTITYGKIKIVSDETLVPICNAEIQVFESLYTYAKITPVYLPEKEAFKSLMSDSVRFMLSTRKLKKTEEDFFAAKKFFPRQTEVARDAVAIILNPSNNDTILSVETIKEILTGKIQQWKEINKKSKLGKIQVVFDNPASSTVQFMVDSVTKGTPLAHDLTAMDYNKDVIDYVARNTNSLGIIGVSWVSDKTDSTSMSFLKKVNVALLSKEKTATYDNSYKPFQAYVAKKMYPLVRSIYVINAEPRQGLASGFAAFVASYKGQLIILKSGILPVTQQVTIRSVQVTNDY
jgi:phosphate transport system substrate-binding protein